MAPSERDIPSWKHYALAFQPLLLIPIRKLSREEDRCLEVHLCLSSHRNCCKCCRFLFLPLKPRRERGDLWSYRGTCSSFSFHACFCSWRADAAYNCCNSLDARRSCWILIILTRHARRDCERSAYCRAFLRRCARDCVEEEPREEKNAGEIKRMQDNFLN